MPLEKETFQKNAKLEGEVIVLDKNFVDKNVGNKFGFKKITGTRLACILGLNHYKTEFKCWMEMVKLYKEEIPKQLSVAGHNIEPLIRDFVASKCFEAEYTSVDPKTVYWDQFQDNKMFGGLIDAEPVKNGKIDYSTKLPMLEIKTSSIDSFKYRVENNQMEMIVDHNGLPVVKELNAKKNSWFKNDVIVIPEEYVCQLSLYLYLKNVDRGAFAVAFLTREDYLHPENFKAEEHEIHVVELLLNKTIFLEFIADAEKWYNDHIVKGISPLMTNEDKKWFNSINK